MDLIENDLILGSIVRIYIGENRRTCKRCALIIKKISRVTKRARLSAPLFGYGSSMYTLLIWGSFVLMNVFV